MEKIKFAALFVLFAAISTLLLRDTLLANYSDDKVTVKGTFTNITRPDVTLKAEDGNEYTIHLGPVWYWEENNYFLTLNSEAEVTGRRESGTKNIYAYSVNINGTTIKLVDDNNNPLWWNSDRGKGKGWGNGKGKNYPAGRCNW
jgi:hypothetical protein